MRYRTRIYHAGEKYPRTLKTHLPADHEVAVEFNAFIITAVEHRDGRLVLRVEPNARLGHRFLGLPGYPNSVLPGVGLEVLVVDEAGRPSGSLQPPRRESRKRRTQRLSLEQDDDRGE